VEDLDARLAAALDGWVVDNREALVARGVKVVLDGPHDPMGMDPVYLLRLDSARAESEATLFRGGTLLLATVDKAMLTVRQSHVDAESELDVTAALTSLADDV
jgi:hypothetical protein